MRILLNVLLISVSIVLVCAAIPKAQEHEPDLQWRTLKTSHFTIHFPKEFEHIAGKVAAICENVYEPVCSSLNYYPGMTHVVLHTRSDMSNGFVAPLPFRMELFLAEPQGDLSGSRDTWLHTLISHEFTHIIQFTKHYAFTSFTRLLLGDLNAFWQIAVVPNWFNEGYAIYNETRLTRGGRGRNPYNWMTMAAPVHAGTEWKLKNSNYVSRKRTPPGMWYVTGYYMINYVNTKYGSGTWQQILERFMSYPLSGFNKAVKKVTGKSEDELYAEMLDAFKPSDETPHQRYSSISGSSVTGLPSNDYSPRWARDKNGSARLLVYHTDFDDLPHLAYIDRDGKRTKLFNRILMNNVNGFSAGETFIVWSEPRTHARFSATYYADLFVYDRTNRKTRRITVNERIYSPDLSPDETRIAAVQNRIESSALVLVGIAGGTIKTVVDLPGYTVINPRWSPDGKQIAFAIRDENGMQDIALVDAETGTWRFAHERDIFHDNEPCWTPNSRFVLYTSDRSGIFNIWAVEVSTGKRQQVTNAEFGAFMPDVSPDGNELAFSAYSHTGFSAVIIPLNKNNWRGENDVPPDSNPLIYPPAASETALPGKPLNLDQSKTATYSPWRQIAFPQGRVPIILQDENGYAFGLFGISMDALHRHQWLGILSLNPSSLQPTYDVTYRYSRWLPRFDFRAFYLPERVTYKEITGWWRKQGFEAVTSLPLLLESNVYSTFFQPYFGIRTQTNKRSSGPIYPKLSNYRGYQAGIQLSRGAQTLRDIAPHFMTSLSVRAEWSSKLLDSEYTAQQVRTLAGVYLPTLIEHHQLQLFAAFQERRGNFGYDYFGALPVGYKDDHYRKQLRIRSGYHFPIAYIEWDVPYIPVYIDYLAGQLFFDWGTSWKKNSLSWLDRKRYSTGIQLSLGTFSFQQLFGIAGTRCYYRSWDKKWTADIFVGFDIPY